MPQVSLVQISDNRQVAADCWEMTVIAPQMAAEARPGQFFHLRCGENLTPLLRRPISLYRADLGKGEISFLYRIRGQGTELLRRKKAGEQLDVMGPLGRGFVLNEGGGTMVLVGGGIGVAPLLAAAEEGKRLGWEVIALVGARTAGNLYAIDRFRETGSQVQIATDDGSAGTHGNTVDLLEKFLVSQKVDLILACGPTPMLQAVSKIAIASAVPCQVSLEEYMGCGVGACLSCACRTKMEPGSPYTYKKVCTDGPVFDAREVSWDE